MAIGGNALLRRGETPDARTQLSHLAQAAPSLAWLAATHELVLVHGNGPQVGMLAMESAADDSLAAPYAFGDLVAETQGLIGYWLQQALFNAGLTTPVVSLVTQTVVDVDDPAFSKPSKFVGSVYSEDQARLLSRTQAWDVAADGDGWRRVVASPSPRRVVELPVAKLLVEQGVTVVLAGGAGVPVVERGHALHGVDAVVDKDGVAALVAEGLGADALVMLTDVEAVMINFGTPLERPVRRMTPAALGTMELPRGSMGPKVEAACRFVERTGGRAAIGALEAAGQVVAGTAGTQVRR